MTTPPREGGRRRAGGRHVVARVDEIAPGGRRIVEVDGRTIGVFNIDGEFVAFLHRCPHMAGPLCSGEVIGLVESSGPGDLRLDETRKFLTCPLHGWEFDVHTGQSYFDPAHMRARRFPVEVRAGSDMADPDGRQPGPYVAETFEVVIEDDYIVIDMGRAPRAPAGEATRAGNEGGDTR